MLEVRFWALRVRAAFMSSLTITGIGGRFATELAGRKGRRKGWAGLAEEMAAAGWFGFDTAGV